MEQGRQCILYKGGEGEILEKKSRFIAQTFPVQSEEEAMQQLAGVKKQHYDARHHCFAFVIGEEPPLIRSGDDGEPSGTAGKPILEVIQGEGLRNVLIVVTRYFGGTLLGTGGLVRAYTKAAQEGLSFSEIVERRKGVSVDLSMDYNDWGKVQYLMEIMEVCCMEIQYTHQVDVKVLIPWGKERGFFQKITEATSGRCRESKSQEVHYILRDQKPELLHVLQ